MQGAVFRSSPETLAGLELVEDNFNEWFEHIDHFVRHRIVPVGEEQTTTERRKTPKTHVKYQYVRFSLSFL